MLFGFKGKKIRDNNNIDIYNTNENEPQSSVIESIVYDFALQKYSESDFRYRFVQEYMKYIEINHSIKIFNCKFEHPRLDSDFLNFYIYLWEDDPSILYRIEDPNNQYIIAFYKMISEYPLPAVTKQLRIQFIVKNISRVMYDRVLALTWEDIHISIKDIFPEIADLRDRSDFYVFIKKDEF